MAIVPNPYCSAPSNAAIDLLVEKLSDLGLQALRIGHPARVTEQSLSKTLDARIAAHPHFHELRAFSEIETQLNLMENWSLPTHLIMS